jgi:anti-sigma factor RsiW
MTHIADNQDALLDYLYDEGDPAERLAIAKHLQECVTCSVAVLELRTVRGMLAEWKPPPAHGSVTLPVPEPKPRRWAETMSYRSWAQIAAGVLLFVSGMAVSQLHVSYADGTLTVRTREASPAVDPPVPAGRAASIHLPAAPVVAADARAASDAAQREAMEDLLQRVRAMIDQSESRQQRELALRLSQVAGEVDAQHQADLLRIQQDFGRQQEMMEYLVKTSGGAGGQR